MEPGKRCVIQVLECVIGCHVCSVCNPILPECHTSQQAIPCTDQLRGNVRMNSD